jgi:hypothetical protein
MDFLQTAEVQWAHQIANPEKGTVGFCISVILVQFFSLSFVAASPFA